MVQVVCGTYIGVSNKHKVRQQLRDAKFASDTLQMLGLVGLLAPVQVRKHDIHFLGKAKPKLLQGNILQPLMAAVVDDASV